jgi:hypothetical protein
MATTVIAFIFSAPHVARPIFPKSFLSALIQWILQPRRKPRQDSLICLTISPCPAIIFSRGGNNQMGNVSKIVKHLKTERDRAEKHLSALNLALAAFVGTYYGAKPTRKKRTMSAAARKKIGAAQRARWKKVRAKKAA